MVELARSPAAQSAAKTKLKIVAAIPCHNTQRSIAGVIKGALKYVDEVIVIDDGSTDLTADAARLAGAKVINHERNLGKGAAMRTALSVVDGDIFVFIDGDGQHNPDDIPKLLAPIILGEADFVIGSRYLNGSKLSANPFLRRAANAVASFVISFVISFLLPVARFFSRQSKSQRQLSPSRLALKQAGYRLLNKRFKWVSDCTSGFTAMKKENCARLHLVSNGYQIETEMLFEQAKNGFVIAETPISCKWGDSVSKLSIITDGSRTSLLILKKLWGYSFNQPKDPKTLILPERI